jgi:hypothetical protein
LQLNGVRAGLFGSLNDADGLIKILIMVGGKLRDYIHWLSRANRSVANLHLNHQITQALMDRIIISRSTSSEIDR